MYRLRGHHLLCLVGYRGMGYSPEYVANMTHLHQTLRTHPKTEILLVSGPDDLCDKFPDSQTCHCEDANIYVRDDAILQKLGLYVGQRVEWSQVQKCIEENMVSTDIMRLCSTCSWRSYGVCEEGIKDIQAGKGLRVVKVAAGRNNE